MTVAQFWAGASSEIRITRRLRGSVWSGRGGSGFGKISGGASIPRGFEADFDSLSGVQSALVLDYAGVEPGQYWDGTSNTLTFDDIHTFTRASLATQRDSAGLVKFVPHNLALQSNGFDTTWAPSRAATMTQTTTGPDGVDNSGWLFKDDGGGSSVLVRLRQTITVNTSTQHILSVFAKKDQLNFLRLRLSGFTTPADSSAWFNLDTGAVGTVEAGFTDSGIEDFGNGWFLCHVQFTTDSSDTVGFVFLSIADNDADNNVDADGTSSIFIFGASSYQAPMAAANDTFADTYVPTTTTAVYQHRLDHDKDGNRIGLMIEEARTNECLASEDLRTSGPWTTANGASSTEKSLTFGISGNSRLTQNISISGTNDITASVQFDPADAGKGVDLGVWATGLDGTSTGRSTTLTIPASGLVSFTWLAVVDMTTFGILTEDAAAYTVNLPSGMGGVQVEVGAFPSSYIPTTTVAVSRAIETCSVAVSAFDWGGDIGGIAAKAGGDPAVRGRNNAYICGTNSGASDLIYRSIATDNAARIDTGKLLTSFAAANNVFSTTALKIAASWNAASTKIALDGSAIGTAAGPADTGGVTELRIGSGSVGNRIWNSHIDYIAVYAPAAIMSDADIVGMATP